VEIRSRLAHGCPSRYIGKRHESGAKSEPNFGACGRSSVVERQLPKLNMRVRFPPPAPASPERQRLDSLPSTSSHDGRLVQAAERRCFGCPDHPMPIGPRRLHGEYSPARSARKAPRSRLLRIIFASRPRTVHLAWLELNGFWRREALRSRPGVWVTAKTMGFSSAFLDHVRVKVWSVVRWSTGNCFRCPSDALRVLPGRRHRAKHVITTKP
jgi:hypothetical protein